MILFSHFCRSLSVVALALVSAIACQPRDQKSRSGLSFSIETELAEFRATSGSRADTLLHAAPSRDSLVHAFVAAVNRKDTTALRQLALSKSEFAWLYYPDSPQSKKPYELDPDLMWMQISARSSRGGARVIREYGDSLGYLGYVCTGEPQRVGALTLYNSCAVRHRFQGKPILEPLFGSIIERDGRFKFVGVSNRL